MANPRHILRNVPALGGKFTFANLKKRARSSSDRDVLQLLDNIFSSIYPDCIALEREEASEARRARTETAQAARWGGYGLQDPVPEPRTEEEAAFRLKWSHERMLQIARAEQMLPWDYQATASGIGDWLYDARFGKNWLPGEGAEGERAVHRQRRERAAKCSVPHPTPLDGWEQFYCGIDEPGTYDHGVAWWPASLLAVDNQPLRCRPDYIFIHRPSRRVRVVELKFSDSPVPPYGWPNLRAQLWAYAHIDEVLDLVPNVEHIELCGEVWYWGGIVDGVRQVSPKWRRTWSLTDAEFHQQNQQLFDLFVVRYMEAKQLRHALATRDGLHHGMTIEEACRAGWSEPIAIRGDVASEWVFESVVLSFVHGKLLGWRRSRRIDLERPPRVSQ